MQHTQTPAETRARLLLMTADRIRGHTLRAIAADYGLSKSHVHRLLRDVPVLLGPRAPRPRSAPQCLALVPHADGGVVAVASAQPPERDRLGPRDSAVHKGSENLAPSIARGYENY